MKNIIIEAEMSLDGVMGGNNPEFWARVFKHHGEDVVAYLNALLFSADALLIGRQTYEAFAQVWPARSGTDADKINAMPKHVASRTLKGPLAWNATLIEGEVAQHVSSLKQGSGNLVQYGIGELTQTMLGAGLVDEVRLLVYPFIFGQGPRIFETFAAADLRLVSTQTFSTGAIACHYRPNR